MLCVLNKQAIPFKVGLKDIGDKVEAKTVFDWDPIEQEIKNGMFPKVLVSGEVTNKVSDVKIRLQ